jgi:hypothetical protein
MCWSRNEPSQSSSGPERHRSGVWTQGGTFLTVWGHINSNHCGGAPFLGAAWLWQTIDQMLKGSNPRTAERSALTASEPDSTSRFPKRSNRPSEHLG